MYQFLRAASSQIANHAIRFRHILSQNVRCLSGCTEAASGSWQSVEGLVKCSANYAPLTPISFLERSAKVHRERTSIIFGSMKHTWEQTHQRCLKLASALSQLGISRGDVVATLAPNVPSVYELHFAAPMAGAILCTLNTRLDSATTAVLLSHSGAKVIFVDHQLFELAQGALSALAEQKAKLPTVILIRDSADEPTMEVPSVDYEYEDLLCSGDVRFQVKRPSDEWDPISLNYTSGTTSRPKGVVYSHRGAYLNAIGTFLLHGMTTLPTYLWTVPMFHCNGWCLPWGVAALGGTNVCLRKVVPKEIFENIVLNKVNYMGGAPTVLNMILNSPETDRKPLPHKVHFLTGGAPPPPQVLFKMEELGFEMITIYGLTETHGAATYCIWKPEWDSLPTDERSKMKARRGMNNLVVEDADVRDPVTVESVDPDGKTYGEIMFRGNTVMNGYFKDFDATEESFKGGWFHSGDLGVKHPDGYIEVKDRLKDIIISGGENISSVQVETVLYSHPAVLEAAVVARPDNHWGQTPCAFVKLKDGFDVNEQEMIKFCRDHLPHYMAPKTVAFEDLPRTSTGKVKKFLLREKAKALGSLS